MIMQKRNKFLLAGCVSVLLVASVVAFTVTFGEAKLVRPRLAEAIAATAPCQNAVSEAFANLGTTAQHSVRSTAGPRFQTSMPTSM